MVTQNSSPAQATVDTALTVKGYVVEVTSHTGGRFITAPPTTQRHAERKAARLAMQPFVTAVAVREVV